jgi:hypothetical protein
MKYETLFQEYLTAFVLFYPNQTVNLLDSVVRPRPFFFTLSRGPAYRLPMPLFYLSVQVIETSILIN